MFVKSKTPETGTIKDWSAVYVSGGIKLNTKLPQPISVGVTVGVGVGVGVGIGVSVTQTLIIPSLSVKSGKKMYNKEMHVL